MAETADEIMRRGGYVSAAVLADIAGVSKSTVYAAARGNRLTSKKVGGKTYATRASALTWLRNFPEMQDKLKRFFR